MKESDKYLRDKERQAILRVRLRLKNLRYTFAVSQKFPRRYLKILENVDSHSDDERIPGSNKYHIKTLECQSKNASLLMRRVDEEIFKAEKDNGKTSNRRERLIPDEPLKSICTGVPKGLPINFYDPCWFNSLSARQKTLIADAFNIAFLPDASQSLRGIQHPNERLGDKKFTNKYWDQVIDRDDISHEIPTEEELNDSDEELDTESEVESTKEESDGEEEAQEWAELNQLHDQDTEMEDVCEPDYLAHGSSHVVFKNEWSAW
ncbi:hypothetical protein O181_129225 [Austropuccinia psidii MF-1]|uniref:Uncharacterized protein n=1 Tax=Austropuccinia psidii MF-1 TaxID=1389203 RepID=A0A9Q3L1K9_9BASI|nr:hypothetical protein [Austropuccinia psidii MF-1]